MESLESVIPVASEELLDIDGNLIQPENLRTDPYGHHFDIRHIKKRDGMFYYRGKLLWFDRNSTVLTQFRGYREQNQPEGDDDDESMPSALPLEQDNFIFSQTIPFPDEKTTVSPTDPPPKDRHNGMEIPKLRDIALDKVQVRSVFKHPTPVSADSGLTPDSFFRNLAKNQEVLRRAPESVRKRKHLGFDAQELLLNGVLSCNPCRPSSLPHAPILTIFREENFLDTPQNVLEVLKPSLALAELILLKGNPRFWVDIACGMRIPDEGRIKKKGSRVETLIPVGTITQGMKDSTMAKLQALGTHLTFKFQPLKDLYGCAAHPVVLPLVRPDCGYLNHGQLWPSNQQLELLSAHTANPWEQQATIIFDSKLYATAKSFSAQKYPDVAAQLRFTFFFAVNLLHEVTHAFEAKCGHGYYYDLISKDRSKPGSLSRSYFSRIFEPRYKDYESREMGACFEYETFGGRIHPINTHYSAKYGLNLFLGNGRGRVSKEGLKEIQAGRPYAYGIPMGYIEELQQQSFWENTPRPNGIMVPTCGPQGFFMNITSTVDWREYLLQSDIAHNVDQLEKGFDEQTHISKRTKIQETLSPSSSSSPRPAKPQPRRRLLQTKLRKYPSKAQAAAAQIKADLIAQATIAEAEASARAISEAVAAEATREYRPPSPHQPAIDEAFHYVNSDEAYDHAFPQDAGLDPSSYTYDPLLKSPWQLTIHDKWLLLEDYALIVTTWDSATFLAKRAAMSASTKNQPGAPHNPLHPLPKELIPSRDPENWGDAHCGMLRKLREMVPSKGLMVERRKKKREREVVKEVWRARAEMEELVVRKGGSRIEWLSGTLDLGTLGLQRMSVDGWDGGWREELERLRAEERGKGKGKGREAVGGNVRENVGREVEAGKEEERNKITNYFSFQNADAGEVDGIEDMVEDQTGD